MAKWFGSRVNSHFDRSIYKRFILIAVLLVLCVLAVVVRVVYIYQLDPALLISPQQRITHSTVKSVVPRASITDRFGYVLAMSVPEYKLSIDTIHMAWTSQMKQSIADILGWRRQRVDQWFANHPKRYAYLATINQQQYSQIKESGLRGVYIDVSYRRHYPLGEKAAHVIGRTDHSQKGVQGLEFSLNKLLQSDVKSTLVKHDRKGRPLSRTRLARQENQAMTTTLDHRIQFFAGQELEKMIQESGAVSGSVVVLNKSGDILALVNYPAFDPNVSLPVLDDRIRNRALIDLFEPGSIIKPLAMAAMLPELGQSVTQVDTKGAKIKLDRFVVSDVRDHGIIPLDDVLKKSSNVAMIKLAKQAKNTDIIASYANMGLFDESDIHLYGEASNAHFSQINKDSTNYFTATYGYGFQVSLLRIAHAYLILANHGVDPGVRLLHNETHKQKRVISAQAAIRVNQMLQSAVSHDGTGFRARIKGVHVSGKTGTAHIQSQGKKGYSDKHMASFVGFAPTENPEYIIAVLLNEPQGMYHFGSRSAAPVFKEIMQFALSSHEFVPRIATSVGNENVSFSS